MADLEFRPEIEILSSADVGRRRQWTEEEKLRIVDGSFRGSRQTRATARQYGISRSLLTRWRVDELVQAMGLSGDLEEHRVQAVQGHGRAGR